MPNEESEFINNGPTYTKQDLFYIKDREGAIKAQRIMESLSIDNELFNIFLSLIKDYDNRQNEKQLTNLPKVDVYTRVSISYDEIQKWRGEWTREKIIISCPTLGIEEELENYTKDYESCFQKIMGAFNGILIRRFNVCDDRHIEEIEEELGIAKGIVRGVKVEVNTSPSRFDKSTGIYQTSVEISALFRG